MFQPVSLLEMEVYHNDLKSMQRIKECNRSYLFKTLFTDVLRHSIALFMVELIYKTLKQPENNPDLFHFCEEALIKLDESDNQVAANMPLYFTLHLCYFFGFRIHPQHAEAESYVDLKEGTFTDGQPDHPYFLSGEDAQTTAELLRVMQVEELATIRLNGSRRRILLHAYLDFYALHIHDFGPMKTLPVLEEILA